MPESRALWKLALSLTLVMGCRCDGGERETATSVASATATPTSSSPATTSAALRPQASVSILDEDIGELAVAPDDARYMVMATGRGELWETRDAGRCWQRCGNCEDDAAGSHLALIEHRMDGPSLLWASTHDARPVLRRVPFGELATSDADQLEPAGRVVAWAADPHPGRRDRVAALSFETPANSLTAGSLAYSDDGGDGWRRFHPSGRVHFASALAFGSDGHLWLLSMASLRPADLERLGVEQLRRAIRALPMGQAAAVLRDSGVEVLDEPAIFAINPARGEVTERLALPWAATLIAVHPSFQGTGWIAGAGGLLRLHGGKLTPVAMTQPDGSALPAPSKPVAIAVSPHPDDGSEQICVALTGTAAKRGVWRGAARKGRWRFERVSERTSMGAWLTCRTGLAPERAAFGGCVPR